MAPPPRIAFSPDAFTFDLQRFADITDLSSLNTYKKSNYYELSTGTYDIKDSTTDGSQIELDLPIVIPSGANVTINLTQKKSGFKEASNFSASNISSLIQIQGNGQLTITATANFSKSNAKIQSSTVDSAISIVAAEGVTGKAKLTIDSAATDNDKNTSNSTYYPCIIGKTYGIKADSAADITIYGGDIHSTGDGGAGIVQADGTLEVSRTKSNIYGKNVGIQFDSTDTSEGGNLNISTGEIYAKVSGTSEASPSGTAILIDNDGVVANISGNMTTSSSNAKYMVAALEIKDLQADSNSFGTTSDTASTVNISGGTLKSYSTKGTTCCAIKNDSNVEVNITGGTFKGKLTGTNYDITGGKFDSNPGDGFEVIYLNSSTKSYVVKGTIPDNIVATSVDSEGVTHYYTSLSMVASYATADDEITLVADIEDALVSIKKNLTINLNGHKVTKSPNLDVGSLFIVEEGANFVISGNGTIDDTTNTVSEGSYVVAVKKGTFTLNGATLNARKYGVNILETESDEANSFTMESGSINSTDSSSSAVSIGKGSSFTLNDGTITSKNLGVGVFGEEATFKMNGGSITADGFGVSNNGTDDANNRNTNIEISNGSITSTGAPAIYNPAVDSTLTISGGTITGTSGVEIRAGELNVTGGTITGTGTSYTSTSNGNGSTSSGAGIAIAQHTTEKAVTVNISGNNTQISGANALAVSNPQGNKTTDSNIGAVAATISGATLKSTATSPANAKNGNAILADNANVNITVTDGTIDGNVTVSKNSDADDNTNATALKMQGGTTSGKVQVVEVAPNGDETQKEDANAKEALQVTGGTYSDTESAKKYTTNDVTVNDEGEVVNAGAGWSLRSGQTYDYLISAGGSQATLLSATIGSGTDSLSSLKADAANYLLGVHSSASYEWSTTESIASLKGNPYGLATFTASGNAITLTPQTAGFKIKGTTFIGSNTTALTANLGSGLHASVGGINVDATNNKLTNITGGAGNDNLLAGDRNTTLDGGAGDDVLQGGTGNDSLNGGSGKDLFYYTAGNDTVNGFDTGDTVRTTTLTAVTDGSKLTTVTGGFKLDFGNSNTLTFTDAAVPVSLSDGSSQYIYTQDLIKQGNSVTLGAGTTAFNGTTDSLSAVTAIDGSAVTGALTITDNAQSNNITFGTGKNTFNYKAGNDVITGYTYGTDTVSLAGTGLTAPTDFTNATFDGSNFKITLGSSNVLTFKGTSTVAVVGDNATYTYKASAADKVDYIAFDSSTEHGISLGAGHTSTQYNGTSTEYATIDASNVTQAIRIRGNDKANYIVGSKLGGTLEGNDGKDTLVGSGVTDSLTLNGGAGDDLLIGGSGYNNFVYTEGSDSISGYHNADLINVTGRAVSFADVTVSTPTSTSDLLIKFDDDNQLSIAGGASANSVISLTSGRNNYAFTKNYIALNGKSITLTGGYSSGTFDGADEGNTTYETINAAAVGSAISIVGNANNNYIVGGLSMNSLNGGAGDDTLVGGTVSTVADLFYYTAGKDVIENFGASKDKLAIEDTLVATITSGKLTNSRLTFTFDKKTDLTFKFGDNEPFESVSLNSGEGYLTKDGVVSIPSGGTSSLDLFGSAKGRIDLTDTLYSGVSIASVNAENVKNQTVTLVGGKQGGTFAYATNKKRDGFEYGGGSATITGYEGGRDRIDLNGASLTSFAVSSDDVVLNIGNGTGSISITDAKGEEVLLRDAGSRAYKKMVFVDDGVVQNKKSNPTMVTVSSGATEYSAANTPTVKKIFVTDISEAANIQAGNRSNTIIDASKAAAAVSLSGGNKNDKLIGNTVNADTFIYGAGKDVIQNFGGSDQISLTGGLDESLVSAKITASKKSIKFKFGNKDVLTIKSNDTMSGALNINGTENVYFKNAIGDSTGSVSLTSGFSGTFRTQDSKRTALPTATVVKGSNVEKNLTFVGSSANETLIGGGKSNKKTMFKGGGGDDSLVGGSGKDTFFYAKGNEGNATIAKFDFANDKLKVASGIIGNITKTDKTITFGMTKGKSTDAVVGSFIVEKGSSTKDTAIKANNTLYWFADGTETLESGDKVSVGQLITSDTKISAPTGYDVIDLNYSTNLVKSGVAIKVTGAKPK